MFGLLGVCVDWQVLDRSMDVSGNSVTTAGHSGCEEDETLTRSTTGWEERQEFQKDMKLGGQKGKDNGEEKIVEL